MADMSAQPAGPTTRWIVLWGALVGALLVDGILLLRFPYVRGNPPILLLTLLTPILIGLVGGLILSRIDTQLPSMATWAVRSALAVVLLVDLFVFVGPLFIGRGTAHDSTPQFVVVPTATTGAAATAAPTTPPVVGPYTFTFSPTPGEGGTTGKAILGMVTGGAIQLRLQGFHTGNGPDLHLLLSRAAQPTTDAKARDGYDLGPLQATDGDKNYAVPAGVDLTTIHSVVIYCVSYNALFGYASR